ncbi:hypothetical protein METESE_26770 [Mesoterricola sediminis]|uniref:Transposase IS4-like domain-containing protein n=1 Tax=Mesoterricola sediminis TaxID=2927980 RepID=A0AA48KD07_9BACT|nr:hypothetical protein METESE_18640 [Mesoterricola sediminis]BDU77401.1 hypothetical protein METESE_23590 [Mesoterricola sediminis]BDU77719.1 hypothetical protein METESE_26770 [Mesoterricola sediminis]
MGARRPGCFEHQGKKGGQAIGPNPTDRGKNGTKHHLITDANGIPMAVLVGPANQHDSVPFEKLIDAVPGIRHGRGRPRRRFRKLHADKAYDFRRCRVACKVRGMLSRIARRGVETAEKLGKHRWVVERTFAWFKHFRRLMVRYERRADIHLAFLKVAASLICFSALGW